MANETLEEGIFARAIAVSGLTDLIGLTPSRFYPVRLPQNPTYPCCMFELFGYEETSAMNAAPKLSRRNLRIHCYATTAAGIAALGRQVRLAFQRYSGAVGGITFQDITVESMNDAPFSANVKINERVIDFDVAFEET